LRFKVMGCLICKFQTKVWQFDMRHSQRIRILMTNFEMHEARLLQLHEALQQQHNATTFALLKREYDEHMYIAQRYARLIVEAEEKKVRRVVERKH